MSKAMQALKNFLTVSPSVVYPDEVLELLQPVEDENDELRKLAEEMYPVAKAYTTIAKQLGCVDDVTYEWEMRMLKLGIEAG